MEDKIKILVMGDVCGHFDQLYQRVENINKKSGPFELLLCVGDFFSANVEQNKELDSYRNQSKKIPLATFILGPTSEILATQYEGIVNGEICPNLTYLGKRGLYTLSSGLRIAYLSGVEQPANLTAEGSKNAEEIYITKDDVLAISDLCKTKLSTYRGVDILLTSVWPKGLRNADVSIQSPLVSQLCMKVIPKYHFSGMNGEFYETKPFRIETASGINTNTRFVGLADIKNPCKQKYCFAISVKPIAKMTLTNLVERSPDEEPCPFEQLDNSMDTKKEGHEGNKRQYFFDMMDTNGDQRSNKHHLQQYRNQAKKPRMMEVNPEACWFCLSRSEVEKQLIVAIGEHFYLAIDKGPVNERHVLILSITHIPSVAQLSDDAWPELLKFKSALKQFFEGRGEVVCFTERNYKSSHLQINVFGLDKSLDQALQDGFKTFGDKYNLEFQELTSPLTMSNVLPNRGPYFVVELPNEQTLLTKQMRQFPLNFAREVICSKPLLDCEEKINWRNSLLESKDEINLVKEFRQQFNKYDFTK